MGGYFIDYFPSMSKDSIHLNSTGVQNLANAISRYTTFIEKKSPKYKKFNANDVIETEMANYPEKPAETDSRKRQNKAREVICTCRKCL